MQRLDTRELRAGDVLLLASPGTHGRIVRWLDGGSYDRAAIVTAAEGGDVLESVPGGVVARPVDQILAGVQEACVVRYQSDDGREFDETSLPVRPIVDKARYYLDKSRGYGHSDAVFLGMLAATRRPPFAWGTGMEPLARMILEPALEELDRLRSEGRVPLLNSAYVFRCFSETGVRTRVRLVRVGGTGTGTSLSDRARGALGEPALPEAEGRSWAWLQAQIQNLFARYYAATRTDPGAAVDAAGFCLPPDVVTPRDLETSPSFFRVGRLK